MNPGETAPTEADNTSSGGTEGMWFIQQALI